MVIWLTKIHISISVRQFFFFKATYLNFKLLFFIEYSTLVCMYVCMYVCMCNDNQCKKANHIRVPHSLVTVEVTAIVGTITT